MKIIFVFFFAFLSLFQFANSQVKVTSVTNHVFYGIIIENTNDTLKLIDENNIESTIAKNNVAYIEEVYCYISLRDGATFYGKIISMTETGIKMECEDGVVRKFNRQNVKISFQDPYFSFFGLTLGTTGGANLLFGNYISDYFGFSIEAGFTPGTIETLWGMQLNLLYNLKRSEAFDHNIGYCWAFTNFYTYSTNPDKSVLGAFYDINYHGLYFQGGLCIGTNHFKNPQLLLQLGYVYRFND